MLGRGDEAGQNRGRECAKAKKHPLGRKWQLANRAGQVEENGILLFQSAREKSKRPSVRT